MFESSRPSQIFYFLRVKVSPQGGRVNEVISALKSKDNLVREVAAKALFDAPFAKVALAKDIKAALKAAQRPRDLGAHRQDPEASARLPSLRRPGF